MGAPGSNRAGGVGSRGFRKRVDELLDSLPGVPQTGAGSEGCSSSFKGVARCFIPPLAATLKFYISKDGNCAIVTLLGERTLQLS